MPKASRREFHFGWAKLRRAHRSYHRLCPIRRIEIEKLLAGGQDVCEWLRPGNALAIRGRGTNRRLLRGTYRALGAISSQATLVMERFFDESGGMQLVLHSPFGNRNQSRLDSRCENVFADLSISSCKQRPPMMRS